MIDGVTVGLPRALLYHWFAPTWETFLSTLGARPVTSPPTNKTVLALALKLAQDEVCLPVKLFLGHAAHLASACEMIFVPHIISIEQRAFTCPKFMGLPDLVRQSLPEAKTLVAKIDIRGGAAWRAAAFKVASSLGQSGAKADQAWRLAGEAQSRHEQDWRTGAAFGICGENKTGPLLAVLGHPYCLYDRFLNMDLLGRLQRSGCKIVTPEMIPAAEIERGLASLPKELFWSFGRRQLGTAYHLLDRGDCRGIIHVTAFACGPEALVGELIERAAVNRRVPLLKLHLDEHTGEAGFLTRLEAFLDMMGRCRR